jgi:hypothetical protein
MPVYAGLILRGRREIPVRRISLMIEAGFEIFRPLVPYFEWFLPLTPHPSNINTVALFHC